MAGKGNPKGAGRPKGVPNKITADIKALASQYGESAIMTLVGIMQDIECVPAARVAAAKEIMDRAYGKAAQAMDVTSGGEKLTVNIVRLAE